MTNTPQVITAIITDTHIGSNTALMSKYVVNSDGQQVFASPAQKWVLASLAQSENHVAASTSSYISAAGGMFYMHAGDYITVRVYQDTGGNLNTMGATLNDHNRANGWLARVA